MCLPGDLIPGKALWKGSAEQAAPFFPLVMSFWALGTPGLWPHLGIYHKATIFQEVGLNITIKIPQSTITMVPLPSPMA